ncbi:MAG: ABC transporter substrate-binding protein [Propionicimonas sp.]|uniref:ABC transporter substrate-binding protein n=1 Tax=Propionicimonas sp. TaxID=1955623 RepID=UPI003D1285E5
MEAQTLIADADADKNSFSADFVPPAQLALAQNNAEAKSRLVTSSAGAVEYLALNVKSPKLKDLKVRQALEYAIDRQAFIVAAGGSLAAEPATTLITPGIPGREDFDLYPAGDSGDVDKAKQLLTEAGVSNLSLTLIVTNDDTSVKKAQAIQQAYQKAGIEVVIKPEDQDTWTSDATGDSASGYDISLSSWQPDYPSAAANIQPLYDSSQIGGGNYNISRYTNADVDAAIAKALGTTDSASANSQWGAIDKQILADAPVVPIVYDKNSFLHGSGVENFYIGAFPAYPVYTAVSLKQ